MIDPSLQDLVEVALREDLAQGGDLTSLLTIPAEARGTAFLNSREHGTLSGTCAVDETFRQVDPSVAVTWFSHDGDTVQPGAALARLDGPARSLLAGERTALNLLGRLSGIATRTSDFVQLVDGTGAAIVDTRKTTPGLRTLEKAAVRHGGGRNHRFGLHDAVLVKDNHLGFGGGLTAVLDRLADTTGHLVMVEVEVDTIAQLETILAFDARRVAHGRRPVVNAVLLDNMTPELVRAAVSLITQHPAALTVDVSGGVDESSVRALAEAGADVISIGALTHSVRCLDVGFDLAPAENA